MKAWIEAFRLRTLPLAFSCILMGEFLALQQGVFNGVVLTLCLVTTLFLQILSNLANDYGDTENGADSVDREGPSRAVQRGEITPNAMKKAMVIFSFLSLISGVSLLFVSFGLNQWKLIVFFLAVGLLAIWAAIKYTAGSSPYGYAGLGDISVFLFFGIVGVMGTNFLFTQQVNLINLLPAISCGVFAAGVLNVNNIRDISSDEKAGKKSIPVRIGRNNAVVYHWVLLILGMGATVLFSLLNSLPLLSYWYVLSFPLFVFNGVKVSKLLDAKALDPFLKQLALSTLLFVLLFGLGTIWV